MSQMGRCPICTLPLPCKHYKTSEEIRPGLEEKKALIITSSSINPSGISEYKANNKPNSNGFLQQHDNVFSY